MATARREYIDAATGVPVPRAGAGAVPSGRWISRIRPRKGAPLVSVEIDREELGPPEFQTVDLERAELVRRAEAAADAQAADDAADKRAAKRKGKQRVRGVAETFRSAGKAAQEYIDANHAFFDALEGEEFTDTIRDWMDGIEVRRGRGWRKLAKTKKGAEIIAAAARRAPWKPLLTWLFSQARGKRWDAVDWAALEELERRIRAAPGADRLKIPPLASRPPGAQAPELALADMTEAQADEAARAINAQRLADAAAELRSAYNRARRCLQPEDRKAALARVKIVEKLAEFPSRVARLVLCVPEGTTRICGLPVLDAEIERLRGACERGYAAGWPVSDAARALAAGDPEAEQYPEGTLQAAERRLNPCACMNPADVGTSPKLLREIEKHGKTSKVLERGKKSGIPWRIVKLGPAYRSQFAVPRDQGGWDVFGRKHKTVGAARKYLAKLDGMPQAPAHFYRGFRWPSYRRATVKGRPTNPAGAQVVGKVIKRAPVPSLAGRACAELGSVLEVETRSHRFRWRKGTAKLLWFPELRALVWLQGVAPGSRRPAGEVDAKAADAFERWAARGVRHERTIRVPALRGSWRSMGAATRIDYFSDKWGRRDEYTHTVSTGATLYRFGGKSAPWIWVLRGGGLQVTTRGIIG